MVVVLVIMVDTQVEPKAGLGFSSSSGRVEAFLTGHQPQTSTVSAWFMRKPISDLLNRDRT